MSILHSVYGWSGWSNLETETVEVHTSRYQSLVLDKLALLDGGVALPGFTLPIHTLFTERSP